MPHLHKISAISPDSISAIRPAVLDELGKRQVNALTNEQLSGLSRRQIRRADHFINALSDQQRTNLSFDSTRLNHFIDTADHFNEFEFTMAQDPLA